MSKIFLFSDGGKVVINGAPKYDLSNPVIVLAVLQKIISHGVVALEFSHPGNKHTIRVPYFGGDEYVNPDTQQVFIIFVDRLGRTLLIFKGFDRTVIPQQPFPENGTLPWGTYVTILTLLYTHISNQKLIKIFSNSRYNKNKEKKSTVLKMSKRFILHHNNAENLLNNR